MTKLTRSRIPMGPVDNIALSGLAIMVTLSAERDGTQEAPGKKCP